MLDQKGEHARIMANFEQVCSVAGLQAKYMYESMKLYCDTGEVDWVRTFWQTKAQGLPGLVLVGVAKPDARCQAICAALIRNYIDARVIPLNTVLDMCKDGDLVNPTVLIIPNLFVEFVGKNIPAWKTQILYDLLLHRSVHNKPSVVYVQSIEGLTKSYGQPFSDFLTSFKQIP